MDEMHHRLAGELPGHMAYAKGGQLVVEWYDFGEGAPYESANMLILDLAAQRSLAAAMDEGSPSVEGLAEAVARRFASWFEFRDLVAAQGIVAWRETDFMP
jgi:hypothetical protein